MHLDDEVFWRFAFERQRIWHRRFVEGLPPPWTEVLRSIRFCNVHRELDAGTQLVFRRLEDRRDWPAAALVRGVMVQRYFNQPDVEWHRDRADLDDSVRRRLERTGPGVFARTWQTNGSSWRAREIGFRPVLLEGYMQWDEMAVIHAAFATPYVDGSLEKVYDALMAQPCIGQVIAWQMALDMRYVFPWLIDDAWVPKMRVITVSSGTGGHGPAASTRLIAPGQPFDEVVRELRDRQDERLRLYGLDWATVAWEHKPRLTLADVEHTLCEWTRYRKVAAGGGGNRRRRFGLGNPK